MQTLDGNILLYFLWGDKQRQVRSLATKIKTVWITTSRDVQCLHLQSNMVKWPHMITQCNSQMWPPWNTLGNRLGTKVDCSESITLNVYFLITIKNLCKNLWVFCALAKILNVGYGHTNLLRSPDAPSSRNMDSGQTVNSSEFKPTAHVNILKENRATVNTKQQRKVFFWGGGICKWLYGFLQKEPSLFSQLGVSHFVLWLFEASNSV